MPGNSKSTTASPTRESKAAGSENVSSVKNADEAVEIYEDGLPWWIALVLILLLPICSTAAQLPLTPSHGGIPSAEYHQLMFQTSVVLYFAWRTLYTGPSLMSFSTQVNSIPVLAAWIPFVQLYLTPTARYLGPAYSAALIKGLTLLPLQGLTLSVIRASIEKAFPRADFAVGLSALGLYFVVDYAWTSYQTLILSAFYGLIRSYFMLLISVILLALLRTRWLVWALVPIAHTVLWSPHSVLSYPTQRLEAQLKEQGYSLLTRKEGLTGYLSVVENTKAGFRLLRCDHSVLGGSWIAGLGSWPGGSASNIGLGRVAEPAFAVFVMLEAVRLVEPFAVPDASATALNVGLGVGTTPSAFIAHGIDTTIVELDPVVHLLATKYFDLPSNHSINIEDAAVFVNRSAQEPEPKQYDYIVHDVFTGGAEPTELFTYEFISGLEQLLKPHGTIAINYAIDLNLPSTKFVVNTIIAVFPNCRMYRDLPEEDGSKHVNFVNMVLFCRKTSKPFIFRDPVEADYLGTSTRKTYLLPRLEMNLEEFVSRDSSNQLVANASMVLHSNNTRAIEKWHGLAAKRHWDVMRTVMSDQVWELW